MYVREPIGERIARVEAQVMATNARLTEMLKIRDEAVAEARHTVDRRLEGMNELRRQITDERDTFLTRETSNALMDDVSRRLEAIVTSVAVQGLEVERKLNNVVPEEVYDQRHDALGARVTVLERWQANISGRFAAFAIFGTVFVGSVAAFITHLLS